MSSPTSRRQNSLCETPEPGGGLRRATETGGSSWVSMALRSVASCVFPCVHSQQARNGDYVEDGLSPPEMQGPRGPRCGAEVGNGAWELHRGHVSPCQRGGWPRSVLSTFLKLFCTLSVVLGVDLSTSVARASFPPPHLPVSVAFNGVPGRPASGQGVVPGESRGEPGQ